MYWSALRECCGAQALSWLQMPRSIRAKAFPLSVTHYQCIKNGCQKKSVANGKVRTKPLAKKSIWGRLRNWLGCTRSNFGDMVRTHD